MRLYRRELPVSGEYATPTPVNNELRAIVARSNNLDRWALDGSGIALASKVRPGAYGKSARVIATSSQTVNLTADPVTVPTSPRLTFAPILDDAGLPWATLFDTGDCLLEVGWNCYTIASFVNGDLIWYRHVVLVDGLQLAQPFSPYSATRDSTPVIGHMPLAAGLHLVTPMIEVWHINALPASIVFDDRSLGLVEKAR